MTRQLPTQVQPITGAADVAALIAEADAVGLVSDREVREGSVRTIAVPSGGAVRALVVRGHVIGYAKRQVTRVGEERSITTRLGTLDLAPRVHGGPPTLWTSALPGPTLSQLRGTMADLADAMSALGLAVARLHTHRAARSSPSAPRPWVLGADLRPPGRGSRLSPPAARVLRVASSDPALRRAARQTDDRWAESGLIHGDLSSDHVVVQPGPDVRARFVGLGRAGLGDPSWDVACALETIAQLAAQWRAAERVLVDYFLRAYRRAGGPGRLDPELRALRAVEIAWQIADAGTGISAAASVEQQVGHWLARARAFADQSGQSSWAA